MTLRTDIPDLTATVPQSPPTQNRRGALIGLIVLALVLIAGAGYMLKGSGVLHWFRTQVLGWTPRAVPPPPAPKVPSIAAGVVPEDVATGIDVNAPILIRLDLPNGPLDPTTVSDDSVGLFHFASRQRVPAKVTIVPEGIKVVPNAPLQENANYRFHVLPGLRDVNGGKIKQNTYAFFTTAKPPVSVAFERVEMGATAKGEGFTCLEFGPDGKLYAATHEGKLVRFTLAADGKLENKEVFDTIMKVEGGPRLFTGFTFDPKSTAENPVIYLTHSAFGFEDAADWSGKVCRLSGANFDKLEELVIHLPRSARDHTTNQPKFGPDGALYIPQPSNTAIGGPDSYWMMREEHGLNATILRLDLAAMTPGQVIDAKTKESGGPFDIDAAGSPLTIYAKGLRMPYDLVWHTNGSLYTGVNGASSRGATIAGTAHDGAKVPGIARADLAEHDWFFKIEKGRYYGHPNPVQGHYVLNGGNPTAGPDFNEVADYPVGVQPDRDFTPAAYDFGMHVSANGMIEYRSDRFGGALKGKIFVCRYNIGSDLLCIGLKPDGSVATAVSGIPGTQKLVGPLDVIEDRRTGNLYVAEYYERQPSETRITLLRAVDGGPAAGPAAH